MGTVMLSALKMVNMNEILMF